MKKNHNLKKSPNNDGRESETVNNTINFKKINIFSDVPIK
jgi:hypothetical protein